MANVIGNLRAILSLNTKSFVAGLTTAGRATKQFRGSMFNLGQGLARVGSFFAGFVAPGAAIWATIDQFRELSDLADLSERLNINPKALQGFRLAAMDAGLAAEDTTTALQFMLKTVGEAAGGSKEAIKAVSGLGLSIKDLSASSSEEILYRIADALQQIPLASVRAAKEVDLFGRSGAKLDAALKGGRGSLKGLEKEMEGMGRAFSKEQLDKVDKAGDAFNRLKESLKGLADSILVTHGEKLEAVFKSLTKVASESTATHTDKTSTDVNVILPKDYQPPGPSFINPASEADRKKREKKRKSHLNHLQYLKRQGFKLDPAEQQELKDAGGPVSMGGSGGATIGLLRDICDSLDTIKRQRAGMVA